MTQDAQDESLEESIFKTLSNQKRRDILRVIGEREDVTFTEIWLRRKEDTGCQSSVETHKLLSRISTYRASTSVVSSLRRGTSAAIVAKRCSLGRCYTLSLNV